MFIVNKYASNHTNEKEKLELRTICPKNVLVRDFLMTHSSVTANIHMIKEGLIE